MTTLYGKTYNGIPGYGLLCRLDVNQRTGTRILDISVKLTFDRNRHQWDASGFDGNMIFLIQGQGYGDVPNRIYDPSRGCDRGGDAGGRNDAYIKNAIEFTEYNTVSDGIIWHPGARTPVEWTWNGTIEVPQSGDYKFIWHGYSIPGTREHFICPDYIGTITVEEIQMATFYIKIQDENGVPIPYANVILWNETQDGTTCSGDQPSDTAQTGGNGIAGFGGLNVGDKIHYKVDSPPSGYQPDRCHSWDIWKTEETISLTLYEGVIQPSPSLINYTFFPESVEYLGSVNITANVKNNGGAGDIYARIYDTDTGGELASVVSYFASGETKPMTTAFVNMKQSGTINLRLVVGSDERHFSVPITALPPQECTLEAFTLLDDLIYETGGISGALNRYSTEQNREYKLTVSKYANDSINTGQTTKPGDRPYSEIINGWLNGFEKQRSFCQATNTWYWVTRSSTIEDITPPPVVCSVEAFTLPSDAVYLTDGTSDVLNRYSTEKDRRYKLTVSRSAISVSDTGSATQPTERPYAEIIEGWIYAGIEETRELCQASGTWYWVMRPATLEDITPPECTTDEECDEGYECIDGKCTPIEKPKWPLYLGVGTVTVAGILLLLKKGDKDA